MGHNPPPVKPLTPQQVAQRFRAEHEQDLSATVDKINQALVAHPPGPTGRSFGWSHECLRDVKHPYNRERLIKAFREAGWTVEKWNDQKERASGITLKPNETPTTRHDSTDYKGKLRAWQIWASELVFPDGGPGVGVTDKLLREAIELIAVELHEIKQDQK